MRKTIGILSVLLVAQLLLAAGMSRTGPDLTAVSADTPLVDLGAQTADRITIEAAEGQKLVLARRGDDWMLSDTGSFPADTSKVDRLLDRLRELKRGLPVATSEAGRNRFKVNDTAFERRVTIARNDKTVAMLYLGTSPGMRQVHARTRGDDGVYTVEFGVHEIPVSSGEWEDKTVLQVPRQEIRKIILTGLTLTADPAHSAGGDAQEHDLPASAATIWTGDTLSPGETVNIVNVDALAEKLAGLRIGAVLGTEEKLEYGLEKPELVIGLQREGGQEVEYRLGKRQQENDFVLQASSRPEYFRLPGYTGNSLLQAAQREQLITAAAQTDDTVQMLPAAAGSPAVAGTDEPAQDIDSAELTQ